MFIEYSYAWESEKHETLTTLFWFRYETLLPSLSLGFRHEEREAHTFYYADYSSIVSFQLSDSTNARAHSAVHNWIGLTQIQKSTCFV